MQGTVSIFDGCGTDEQFRYCTLLEASLNDGLPSKLCELCTEHMKIAYDFRFQATYAEKYFLSTVLQKDLISEAEQENILVENIEDLNENMQEIGKLLSHRVADDFEPVVIETTINKDNNRSTLTVVHFEDEEKSLQSDISDDHFSNALQCSGDNRNVDIFEENVSIKVSYKKQNKKLACKDNALVNFADLHTNVGLRNNFEDSTAIYLSSCTGNVKNLPTSEENPKSETKLKESFFNYMSGLKSVNENVLLDRITPTATDISAATSQNPTKLKKKSKLFERSKQKSKLKKENKEQKIECNICGTSFTHINSLKQHLMKHSGEKPFKCEFCGKCFARKTILTIHRRLHTGDRPYRCDECIQTFVTKEALNRHKERDHDDDIEAIFLKNKVSFICSICNKARCSKYSLVAHMRTHAVSNEEPNSISICHGAAEKVEQQISDVPQKLLVGDVESPSLSTFKYCKICQQGFTSKWELVTHQEIHRTIQSFECYICRHTFEKKYKLMNHLKTHENGEMIIKNYIQNTVLVDTKKSTAAADVLNDVREQLYDENIEVDEDDIPLEQRRRKHKLICFRNVSSEAVDDGNEFKCQMCKKTFSHFISLKAHIMKHLGDRSFQCEHCCKTFGRKTVLDMHRRQHTSELMYKCPLCEMTPTSKKYLLDHLNEFHHEGSTKNQLKNTRYIPQLQNLVKLDTEKKSFILLCNLCNAECSSIVEYTKHLNVHDSATSNILECRICAKRFSQRFKQIFHMETHQIKKK